MNKNFFLIFIIISVFFYSCHSNDYESTRREIENADDVKILSLYHKAIEDEHADCLELTLQKDAISLEEKLEGKSSLLEALENNKVEVVKLFLRANIQPDYYFMDPFVDVKKNMTLLMIASKNGSIDVVNLLISKKVNVNFQREDNKRTALIYAAANGEIEVYKKLIKVGADISLYDKEGLSAVHYAAKYNHPEIIEFSHDYVNYGSKETGLSPLMYAIIFSNAECVEKLAAISDLNYKTSSGWTALHIAAVNEGTAAEIEILLKAGADFSLATKDGLTPLEKAVAYNKYDNVKTILTAYDHSELSYGADKNNDGSISYKSLGMAILRAAYLGYDDILRLLLDNSVEAEKTAKDNDGSSALTLAIDGKHPATAKFLIENTNLINSPTNSGFTPIMLAIQSNDIETFNLLLEKNCDLKQKTNNGETVFSIAEESENKEFYKKLNPKRVILETQLNMVKIPGYRFAASKYEVTQELYEKVLGIKYPCGNWRGNGNGSYESSFWAMDGGWLSFGEARGAKRPAYLTYNDAIYFCNKLSVMCGLEPVYSVNGTTDYTKWAGAYSDYCDYQRPDVSKHYRVGNLYAEYLYPSVKMKYEANGFRLPLKEEWEISAKAGKNYDYSGSDDIYEVAWFEANSGNRCQPVGKKRANNYGLFDMTGNAPEWIYEKDSVGGSAGSNADDCILKETLGYKYFNSYSNSQVSGLRLFRTVN